MNWVGEWFGAEISELLIFPSGKDKLRACSPELEGIGGREVIRGIYIAKKAPYGFIISIEGSFLIGRNAKRHIVELSEEEFEKWMRGEDIEIGLPERGVYLVKFGQAFAGSGYYNGRVLRNLVPKVRTVEGGLQRDQ